MATVTHWISAFRLRTLFLAATTVVLGSGLAWHENSFSVTIFLLALALAVSIQILSNLANDWGDFFAFLFFGPVLVIGTYFLHVHALDFQPLLSAIGFRAN